LANCQIPIFIFLIKNNTIIVMACFCGLKDTIVFWGGERVSSSPVAFGLGGFFEDGLVLGFLGRRRVFGVFVVFLD